MWSQMLAPKRVSINHYSREAKNSLQRMHYLPRMRFSGVFLGFVHNPQFDNRNPNQERIRKRIAPGEAGILSAFLARVVRILSLPLRVDVRSSNGLGNAAY